MKGVRSIVDGVKREMEKKDYENLNSIIMHGTGSEIKLLQVMMENEFPNVTVKHPEVKDEQAIQGCVFFGHDPTAITFKVIMFNSLMLLRLKY